MKTCYSIKVRKYPNGVWQMGTNGSTAREAKRKLAKMLGIPQSKLDSIPVGKSFVDLAHPTFFGNCQIQLKKLG